jgi:YegS/Rv2252/BmrU family lipid kinase
MPKYLAIINPAAGGGRCGKLAEKNLELLREGGINLEVAFTRQSGDACRLAREGYSQGFRHFLAVGGDGTSYEIINGLFGSDAPQDQPVLGFLPLGTGNSFLRDFTDQGLEYARQAILEGSSRPCDVLRLIHKDGRLHYINLLSFGFTADAGELTNSRFKSLGEIGYLAAIFLTWLRLHYPIFPLRMADGKAYDRNPCIYLTFSNSRYTGGKLMIAPFADTADGLIEVTKVGALGRWDFVRTFPKIFTGQHMQHPLISHAGTKAIDFQLPGPIDVMIDGEVVRCHPERIEVLPASIEVMV